MSIVSGHRKLLEQLLADDVQYIFGNPGSTEEGLLDELSRCPELRYVLGLQEAAVTAIADGYAQSTQRPAVLLLHSGVGVGNAVSGLYHALRKRTPLLVLAGEAGVSVDALEAHMALDLVSLAKPVTKYAARAIHPGSVLRLVRRCLKVAATPPMGPVLLALPQDVLDHTNNEVVTPTLVPDTRVAPTPARVAQCAQLLCGANEPVILVGDGVSHSQAQAELARVAEVLGARVYGLMASEVCLPWTHPLWCGLAGHMFGEASAARVRSADAVVIVGTYAYPEVFPSLDNPVRGDVPTVHIDLNAYDIAKNHPVTVGLVSDPKLTLAALASALDESMSPTQKEAAAARVRSIGAVTASARESALNRAREQRDTEPLHMSAFMEQLRGRIPADAIIYDEALTNSNALTQWLPPVQPGSLLQTPGGTLGVGLPGAIGAKLARPDRVVIGFSGDGGSMYTLQALWTAAHYRIGAKFVVCNNGSYRLLKQNIVDYWNRRQTFEHAFPPSFDLLDPPLDFVALANGMGVPAARVDTAEAIAPAIAAMLEHAGPYLIDLHLEGNVTTSR